MARADGLPHPVTIGESYLAAILDELRDLKSMMAPVVLTEKSDEIRVREPEVHQGKRKKFG